MLTLVGSAVALLGSLWFVILRQVIVAVVLAVFLMKLGNIKPVFFKKKRNIIVSLLVIILLYLLLPQKIVKTMSVIIRFLALIVAGRLIQPLLKNENAQNIMHSYKENLRGRNNNMYDTIVFWQKITENSIRTLAIVFIAAIEISQSIISSFITLIIFIGVSYLLCSYKIAQKIEWDSEKNQQICTILTVLVAILRFAYYLQISGMLIFILLIATAIIAGVYFGLKDGKNNS
jgi:hypothetical protein